MSGFLFAIHSGMAELYTVANEVRKLCFPRNCPCHFKNDSVYIQGYFLSVSFQGLFLGIKRNTQWALFSLHYMKLFLCAAFGLGNFIDISRRCS